MSAQSCPSGQYLNTNTDTCIFCREPCAADEFEYRPCFGSVDAACGQLPDFYQLVFEGSVDGSGTAGVVFSTRNDTSAYYGEPIEDLASPSGCEQICNFYNSELCRGYVIEASPGESTVTCFLLQDLGTQSGLPTMAHSFSFSRSPVCGCCGAMDLLSCSFVSSSGTPPRPRLKSPP